MSLRRNSLLIYRAIGIDFISGERVLRKEVLSEALAEMRGQMALDRGDPINAIADFRSVIKDQPNSVPVMTQLARAHLANGEPELAKETLGKEVTLYPKQAEVRVLMAELKAATNDPKGASEELELVLNQDPKNFRALDVKANIAASQRDWKAAEETLMSVKKAYPDDARVYQRLGSLYLAQKRPEQAVAAYEAALARVPGAIEPLTGLSNVYLAQQKPQLAVARVEQALKDSPENFLAYALLARLEAASKHDDKAEAAFRKAVSMNSRIAGTHIELSNYLLARGNAAGAERALKDGLSALPDDAGLSFRLAETYRVSGQTEKAIGAYEDLVKRDPGNDLAANNLANLLLDLRQDKASFERAKTLALRFERSNNPAYVDTLGWAHFRLGEYDQAVPLLQKAAERAPQIGVFQFHLGMALYRKGDLGPAKAHLQKALEAKIEFPGIEEARQILAAG